MKTYSMNITVKIEIIDDVKFKFTLVIKKALE